MRDPVHWFAHIRRSFCLVLVFSGAICGAGHAEAAKSDPFGGLPAGAFRTTRQAREFLYKFLAGQEARRVGLPSDLVDTVLKIESDYDPSRIGSVGEIGLMQVRPGTAALLGFRGSLDALADPATNIHYGALYLGQAWRLTNGDVCRTLMKYRAGHGEERMSALSAEYCTRARAHLAAIGSPLADAVRGTITADLLRMSLSRGVKTAKTKFNRPLHGPAFWIAEEARVRAAKARLDLKWRRLASR